MRRSTLDVALGRRLTINQTWTETATGRPWRVIQIHRADCQAELEHAGQRRCIRFAVLRNDYQQAENLQLEAA